MYIVCVSVLVSKLLMFHSWSVFMGWKQRISF